MEETVTETPHPLTRREARNAQEGDLAASGQAGVTAAPDDPELAAKMAKAQKIGNIVRYAVLFIMPLIMVGMMITGYLGAMHSPTPHGMPVVVAGNGADGIVDDLNDVDDDAVSAEIVDDRYDARDAVYDRDAVAAVVVGNGTATVYTATAAGAGAVTTVMSLVTPALLADGLTIENEDIAPLPDSDPAGLGAMFLATALVMAGYLPFSVLRSNSPELLTFRRAVPLIAGWAALIAGLVWTVTGPILGVIDLVHTPAVLGIAWLGVFAIASVQLFITRLFGPMGVIFGLLFLMVLGMPSSNMAMSVHTMPAFYQFLHSFLPMPAIGESMRSVLYFGANGLVGHLLVLATGAVAGLLATKAYDVIQRRRNPNAGPLSVNIPSLHGGRRPDSKFWRYLSLLAFPLAMVTMMVTVMLGAMHSPSPKDMPVAVVGQTTEQAQQAADDMTEQMGDLFDFTALDDQDEAESLVEGRDAVAALVLPSQESPEMTLVANQAGNVSAYQMVDRVFTQMAQAQETTLTVDDVQPLPDRDKNGVVTMYMAMGWIMGGFMVVIVGANAAPQSRPLKRMLPVLIAYAPYMSLIVWSIAGPITGAVDGHFLALWGTGTVAIFSVALFAMVFERLIGMFAIIPAIGTLMFMGMPASNAALSEYMVPTFFRTLHDYLPMPAAAEAIKSIVYFDGDVVWHHVQVLALWGLVSLIVVFIIDQLKPVRTEHDFGSMDPRLVPGYRPPKEPEAIDPAAHHDAIEAAHEDAPDVGAEKAEEREPVTV